MARCSKIHAAVQEKIAECFREEGQRVEVEYKPTCSRRRYDVVVWFGEKPIYIEVYTFAPRHFNFEDIEGRFCQHCRWNPEAVFGKPKKAKEAKP